MSPPASPFLPTSASAPAAGVNGGGRTFVDWRVKLKHRIGIEGSPAALAAAGFIDGTPPRPATANDCERLFHQAM